MLEIVARIYQGKVRGRVNLTDHIRSDNGLGLRRVRGTHSSSNTRIGDQVGLGLLEGCNSNFSSDGGEVVKKLFQRVTAFDVVDEGLYGNARANKHRGAAQNVGVRANDG